MERGVSIIPLDYSNEQQRLATISKDGTQWTLYANGEVAGVLSYAGHCWYFMGNTDESAAALFTALERLRDPSY